MNKYSLLLVFIYLLAVPPGAFAQTVHEDYLDGVMYVKVDRNSGIDLRDELMNGLLFENFRQLAGIDTVSRPFEYTGDVRLQHTYRVEFSETNETYDLIDSLEAAAFIKYAEQYPLYQTGSFPDDPMFQQQWALEKINAAGAWSVTTGSPDVVIAIVDNGVRLKHEDLEENIWDNPSPNTVGTGGIYLQDDHGYDVADHNNDPNPPDNIDGREQFNHGTHCAGIASAVTDNNTGIASIGFSTSVMAVKCAPDNSDGNGLTHAYEGIAYATDAGADIISMSFGSEGSSITGSNIIQNAFNNNIVLVAAAGNNDSEVPFYPAAFEETIAVGASGPDDEKASFSNYGDYIDVMAPGTAIKSTLAGDSDAYGTLSGTSMAAPLVSGLAALILSEVPGMSNLNVRQYILDGTDQLNDPEYEGKLGTGRINAEKTLNLVTSITNGDGKSSKPFLIPNPATNYITVSFPDIMDHYSLNFTIIDLKGRKIKSGNLKTENPDNAVNITMLPPGMYIMQLSNEDLNHSLKFIIR